MREEGIACFETPDDEDCKRQHRHVLKIQMMIASCVDGNARMALATARNIFERKNSYDSKIKRPTY